MRSPISHGHPPQRPPSVNPYAPKPEVNEPMRIPVAHPNISQAPVNHSSSPVLSHRNPYAPKPEAANNHTFAAPVPPPVRPMSAASTYSGVAPLPPHNPYAPTAPVNNFAPPAPAGSSYAPPPAHNASFVSPPPPTKSVPPPPPAASIARASPVPPPPASPAAAANGPVKYPAGDRSHFSPEGQQIYQVFSTDLENFKGKVPEKFKRQINDAEKRLNILFDHLNNNELPGDTVSKLTTLSSALAARDFKTAEASQTELAADKSNNLWMVGVKRLVGIVSALGDN
ncbi:unnamed protein product [Ambrosiozyma monospora]|uniref:Unnamed protein product n=1 Tax=Ambrosiozyma monospora TaxID=43982 RepID=A0ACB5TBS7_AMBMO|nr:unnamed protein product [Ambrosiozyma monospora]